MFDFLKLQHSWTLYLEGIGLVIVGAIVVKIIGKLLRISWVSDTPHFQQLVIAKMAEFLLNILVIILALDHVGIDLKILLGAAGIFTVAIGFASQTSASNFISGIFLVTEKPFRPGDVIKINESTGVVISIDLLSTRLRTIDNLLIRVPNEILMKSQITNITYFDIRRVDIKFQLGLQEDLESMERSLHHLAELNPLIFDEPRPLFIVDGFVENLVQIQYSFWVQKDNYLIIKNKFCSDLLKLFKTLNINLPNHKWVALLEQDRKPPVFQSE